MRISLRSLEIGIGDVARRAVVFDEILIVLVVRRRELRERAQVLGRSGIGLERTRCGRAGRILAARTRERASGPTPRTSSSGSDHGDTQTRRMATPSATSRRNMAIASISTSRSGRQRIAWMPVDAGSGSSPCSLKNAVRSSLKAS